MIYSRSRKYQFQYKHKQSEESEICKSFIGYNIRKQPKTQDMISPRNVFDNSKLTDDNHKTELVKDRKTSYEF